MEPAVSAALGEAVRVVVQKLAQGKKLTTEDIFLLYLGTIVEELRTTRKELAETNRRIDAVIEEFNRQLTETNKRIDEVSRRIDETNKRIDAVVGEFNRRFEEIDKRLDETNKRIDETNKRIDDLYRVLSEVLRLVMEIHRQVVGRS